MFRQIQLNIGAFYIRRALYARTKSSSLNFASTFYLLCYFLETVNAVSFVVTYSPEKVTRTTEQSQSQELKNKDVLGKIEKTIIFVFNHESAEYVLKR